MHRASSKVWLVLLASFLLVGGAARSQTASYLPLQVNTRWVLQGGRSAPVTIEVVSKEGNAYRIRFSNPWGENEWDLEPQGSNILMTGFGANGKVAPMPGGTKFFSFAGNRGETWTNAIGTLSVSNTHFAVAAGSTTYRDCIQVKQVSGKAVFLYSFAPGVGFVQFEHEKDTFVLDASASQLPGAGAAASSPSPKPDRGGSVPPMGAGREGRLQVGVTASVFAGESATPQNLLRRFDQISAAGITFLSSAQKWPEIEEQPGHYRLEGLDFQVATAGRLGIPMSVTLRIVDTVDRVTPAYVKRSAWDSPEMAQRVLPLIDAMAGHFRGRVKWFMFGNEIDGYFTRHPDEIPAFTRLFAEVKRHVRQHSPQTQVSSTLMFGGIDTLRGILAPLNAQYDFLSFTYYPIRGNFTMRAPDSVFGDFDKMHLFAERRKIVLQEIGYPSSALNDSSQDRQAEFYQDVFKALRQDRGFIEAGNFFLLADLSDRFVKDLAGFYGMPSQKVFLAYLQTLGLFDLQGQPKKSWSVYQSEMKHP